MQPQVKIRPDLSPPPGAEHVGFHSTRHGTVPIFEERVPVFETRQRRDAAGKPLHRLNQYGQATRPLMEQVQKMDDKGEPVFEVRRFIPTADLWNGVAKKNYDFEPSKLDAARAEARKTTTPEELEKRLRRLEGALAATTGLTLEDAEQLAEQQANRQQQRAQARGGKG